MRRFVCETLVLPAGAHPFIKHEPFVLYSTAGRYRVDTLTKALKKGLCHLKEDMDKDLLRRVRDGLLASPYTVNAIRDECELLFAWASLGSGVVRPSISAGITTVVVPARGSKLAEVRGEFAAHIRKPVECPLERVVPPLQHPAHPLGRCRAFGGGAQPAYPSNL